jgi:hypothetical protein
VFPPKMADRTLANSATKFSAATNATALNKIFGTALSGPSALCKSRLAVFEMGRVISPHIGMPLFIASILSIPLH